MSRFLCEREPGKDPNLNDPKVKKNYRNSFNWFGYGVDE